MGLILRLAANTLGVWLAVALVDGLNFEGTWLALAGIAVVMAIVNALVGPIIKMFSLPFVILTLGLFLLVVNAILFALTIWLSGQLDLGLTSTGFGATFLGALVVTVVAWAGERLAKRAS